MTAIGRVAELWVFPVKSMAGAAVESAPVEAGGLVGDRSWAVIDEDGKTVSAADEPRLREVTTRLLDGELRLDVPGGQSGLAADAAAEALSAFLGRTVRLAHREGTGFVDVAPVHVVSRGSIVDAVEHAQTCDACDIENPRANLVLALDQGSERDWVGSKVTVGEATLEVVREPKHCLGIYADVAVPGTVRVGDRVELH